MLGNVDPFRGLAFLTWWLYPNSHQQRSWNWFRAGNKFWNPVTHWAIAFQFHLLPRKYYLPNIIYQVQSITKHAWVLIHAAFLQVLKLFLIGNYHKQDYWSSNFTCLSELQTSIFISSRAKLTCPDGKVKLDFGHNSWYWRG